MPKSLYDELKSHYLRGDFNTIDVTFYHLGCEIICTKDDGEQIIEYKISDNFHFKLYTFFNEKIGENCNLEFYSENKEEFKIKLVLLINHSLKLNDDFALSQILNDEVLSWISEYLGETVDIDNVYLSLELFGWSGHKHSIEEMEIKILVDTVTQEIEIIKSQIEDRVNEIILNNFINLIKPVLGNYSIKYSFSAKIDYETSITIVEDCDMGNILCHNI